MTIKLFFALLHGGKEESGRGKIRGSIFDYFSLETLLKVFEM